MGGAACINQREKISYSPQPSLVLLDWHFCSQLLYLKPVSQWNLILSFFYYHNLLAEMAQTVILCEHWGINMSWKKTHSWLDTLCVCSKQYIIIYIIFKVKERITNDFRWPRLKQDAVRTNSETDAVRYVIYFLCTLLYYFYHIKKIWFVQQIMVLILAWYPTTCNICLNNIILLFFLIFLKKCIY